MDKNILTKIGIVLFVLLFVFFIYKIVVSDEETYFKRIELSQSNEVTNRTTINYLDTVVSVALDKLAIENIKVLILPLNKNHIKSFGSDLEIRAHVRAYGDFYYIWIDDLPKDEHISVLSHEIIHIHQYYTGRIVFEDNKVMWNKKEFNLEKTPYEDRPWENEAFILQEALKSQIIKELY